MDTVLYHFLKSNSLSILVIITNFNLVREWTKYYTIFSHTVILSLPCFPAQPLFRTLQAICDFAGLEKNAQMALFLT